MNGVATVRAVADAVLYEGYILYPYRASAQKNRSRWQFGVVMPAGYVEGDPSERAAVQTECILENSECTSIEVVLRFLHVQRRTVEPDTAEIPNWDEAVEREVRLVVDGLAAGARHEFAIPGGTEVEDLPDGGRVTRRQAPLAGVLTMALEPLPGPWRVGRLRVRVENLTDLTEAGARDAALPSAFLAAHLILAVRNGAFVSMIDPPEWAWAAVEDCDNVGLWPVLGGPAGDRTLMLAAPIILYDHPELAPESPGDLYDGTEIDEILTLRTLAMSDEEKREARATDPRAAAVIDRTESLDADAMARLHGTIRELRVIPPPAATEDAPPWWDPGVDASVSPSTDAVHVNGVRVARGSRVVLRPGARRADAQDMFLRGRDAVVEAVLLDVDDNAYLAVTLADDPAGDLLRSHGRFLYFAPDEVEPSEAGSEVIP